MPAEDWQIDRVQAVQEACLHLGSGWTGVCGDGTVCALTPAEAKESLATTRAIQTGPNTIRWLRRGETVDEALETEARVLAARRGITVADALIVMAGINSREQGDPTEFPLATQTLVLQEAGQEHGAHRRILRRHASELRRAHGLRADDPVSALALPRHARRPPLNAKHRGRKTTGTLAKCSDFRLAAMRLAGPRRERSM